MITAAVDGYEYPIQAGGLSRSCGSRTTTLRSMSVERGLRSIGVNVRSGGRKRWLIQQPFSLVKHLNICECVGCDCVIEKGPDLGAIPHADDVAFL